MTDSATNRKRGNSKPNVKKRGKTYTYYVYITGPDGGREQHSKSDHGGNHRAYAISYMAVSGRL